MATLKIEIGRTDTLANGDSANGEMTYAWASHDYTYCGQGNSIDECKADASLVATGNMDGWEAIEVFSFNDDIHTVEAV